MPTSWRTRCCFARYRGRHGRVVERFGEAILDDERRIVRALLAELVFGDAEARGALNAIVHPEVRAEFVRRVEAYAFHGNAPIAMFDAALLVETGAYRSFHRLVVARCSVATQLHRLVARDGLSIDQARARIDSQLPVERKVALADYVIDTEGDPARNPGSSRRGLRQTRRRLRGGVPALSPLDPSHRPTGSTFTPADS